MKRIWGLIVVVGFTSLYSGGPGRWAEAALTPPMRSPAIASDDGVISVSPKPAGIDWGRRGQRGGRGSWGKMLPALDYSGIPPHLRNKKHLYYVGPNGNDGNPGTMELPFKNINFAVYQAQTPAVVYVLPGKYSHKGATTDFFVSLKDGVDLVCIQTQKCVIHGPIYPASNTTVQGFVLWPLFGDNQLLSTNEIALGLSRFGSPHSGNIHFPTKYDLYVLPSIKNVVIKDNYVYNNQIRLLNASDVVVEDNRVHIDRYESQNWSVQLVSGNRNVTIKNNIFSSGRYLDKQGNRPARPSGILVQNSENVLAEGNRIVVQTDRSGKTIGYGSIVWDSPSESPKSANCRFQNNAVQGSFIKLFKDYTKEYCGNGICEEDEVFNGAFGFEYNCPQDCCGNNRCDPGEVGPRMIKKGYKGTLCGDCQ